MASIRRAERPDLTRVESLLKQADLPTLDPGVTLSNVLVAQEERRIAGAIALEVFGRSGLVRSVVVAPEQRGQGLGRELFRSLMARAHELSLRELYVRAGGSEGFFTALGFEPVEDPEIPIALRQGRAFRSAGGPAAVLSLRLR